MIVAIIIEDQFSLSIGSCLSDASVFMIYDSEKKSQFILPLPDCNQKEMRAKCFSLYLKKHLVEMVFARDLGPKAKSTLDDLQIAYSSKMENDSVKDIKSYINKK